MSTKRMLTLRSLCATMIGVIALTVTSTTIHAVALESVKASSCLRLFQQYTPGFNVQISTLDTRSGQMTTGTQPIIPPDAWLSPNGKYAAFWQMTQDEQPELYLAPASGNGRA